MYRALLALTLMTPLACQTDDDDSMADATASDSGSDGSTGDGGGEDDDGEGEDGDSQGDDTAADGGPMDTGTTATDTGEDDTGGDTGGEATQCDVWAQDCPEGEKCTPYAADGGTTWNATKCVDVAGSPKAPGDECIVSQSDTSGLDDCEKGSMCWDVDFETFTGTCVELCTGSLNDPTCSSQDQTCMLLNDGVLNICLTTCDPISQDCPTEGEGCYPSPPAFICAPDASQGAGLYGVPCEYGVLNACTPGLFCAPAGNMPNCTETTGCCTSFCDLTEEDPSAVCPGTDQGQTCIPANIAADLAPGWETVGFCVVPN